VRENKRWAVLQTPEVFSAKGDHPMTDVVQVATTTGNREEAQRIAAELIDKHLAACVQLSGPITSYYHWEGRLETSQEWRLTVKTTLELYDRVEETIRNLHLYDLPEILATPVVAGSDVYVQWVKDEVAEGRG
jgi:periplasmic divalent cation tolerance protein